MRDTLILLEISVLAASFIAIGLAMYAATLWDRLGRAKEQAEYWAKEAGRHAAEAHCQAWQRQIAEKVLRQYGETFGPLPDDPDDDDDDDDDLERRLRQRNAWKNLSL